MALVDYGSDSDSDSGPETAGQISIARKDVSIGISSPKPAFQKVANRSGTYKIRDNLPWAGNVVKAADEGTGEPASKRVKLSNGGGINAMLPAPKRPNAGPNSGAVRGHGLGSGISLKTGATPGFSREPQEPPKELTETQIEMARLSSTTGEDVRAEQNTSTVSEELVLKGNARMFKPLSVVRKPTKKRLAPPASTSTETTMTASEPSATSAPVKTKVSLFSMEASKSPDYGASIPHSDYQPMMYGAPEQAEEERSEQSNEHNITSQTPHHQQSAPARQQEGQSLDEIASDLNLSASARRQLFGRAGKNGPGKAPAINVVNFNTDREYEHNEARRQAGETPEQVHNPLRSINATGKNSLKQLVSAVSNNQDALEEHFAKGRRNQKESGARYGW